MNIDWLKYTELYPDRYLKNSAIDDKIKSILLSKILENNHNIKILDIGANKGTTLLKQFKNNIISYYLDVNMKKPEWYNKQINWKDVFNKKNYDNNILPNWEKNIKPLNDKFIEDIGMIYEYNDKSMNMSINGFPTFSSCAFLNRKDAKRFIELYSKYEEIHKKITEEF